MYAIVEIAGLQYKVQKDQQLYVHRIDAKEGDKIQLDNVMLIDDGGKVNVGAPVIDGAAVSAKVLKHLKGDKVIVFKKKRRKGYKKKNGHRQYLTSLEIEKIMTSGAKRATPKAAKAAPKKEAPKAAAPMKEAPKAAAPKKETPKASAPKASGKGDDLKKIEGIGPKIAETLTAAGIATFDALSKSTPEKISEIIAGVRGNHVTDTWPKQAEMASAGQWDELKKWQDELDGGKA